MNYFAFDAHKEGHPYTSPRPFNFEYGPSIIDHDPCNLHLGSNIGYPLGSSGLKDNHHLSWVGSTPLLCTKPQTLLHQY